MAQKKAKIVSCTRKIVKVGKAPWAQMWLVSVENHRGPKHSETQAGPLCPRRNQFPKFTGSGKNLDVLGT
eukprot:2990090-Amphidinium_carterae.1